MADIFFNRHQRKEFDAFVVLNPAIGFDTLPVAPFSVAIRDVSVSDAMNNIRYSRSQKTTLSPVKSIMLAWGMQDKITPTSENAYLLLSSLNPEETTLIQMDSVAHGLDFPDGFYAFYNHLTDFLNNKVHKSN